jgi:RNA polymerase-binding protein DksA
MKPVTKASVKSVPKVPVKVVVPAKSAPKAPAKPAPKAPAKPAPKAPAKPAPKAPAKPVPKAVPAKPAPKAPAKPAPKAPAKPAPKAVPAKPAPKAPVKVVAPAKPTPVAVVAPAKPVPAKPAPAVPVEAPKIIKPVVGRNIDKSITEILSDLSWAKKLDAQKKRYLDQLLDLLNKMNAQFRDLSANSLEQGGFSTDDVGDMGNIQYTQDMNLRLMQEELESRTMICQAIERLYAGTYGTCVDCGCKIGEKRLEARPYAIYCIDCRERVEKEAAARSGFSYRMR